MTNSMTGAQRSALQDAFHYAVAAAVVNGTVDGYESTIGTSRWEGYWAGRRAPRSEWLRLARFAMCRTGLAVRGARKLADAADYARAILAAAKAVGVDAYTGDTFEEQAAEEVRLWGAPAATVAAVNASSSLASSVDQSRRALRGEATIAPSGKLIGKTRLL